MPVIEVSIACTALTNLVERKEIFCKSGVLLFRSSCSDLDPLKVPLLVNFLAAFVIYLVIEDLCHD